ncbi:MAG: hypothetical protein ACYC36_00265 [Bellilinea sp.]
MSEITPMPTTLPIPSTTMWDQYAVAAIVFVVFLTMVIAGWRIFREYRSWQTAENLQQRTWYEGMELKRDAMQAQRDIKWQQFYQQIQDHQAKRDRDSDEVQVKLIGRIDALTEAISTHDRKSAERADRLENLANGITRKRRPS